MKKFILGLIIGLVIFLTLSYFGLGNFMQGLKGGENGESSSVVPAELLKEGAAEFGSLKVVMTDSQGAFVGNIEVDVGEQPGGKMAVETTDGNGVAFFDKMPVGNYVIFFNEITFPKNFERPAVLIPVKIMAGQTTEQEIILNELE